MPILGYIETVGHIRRLVSRNANMKDSLGELQSRHEIRNHFVRFRPFIICFVMQAPLSLGLIILNLRVQG